MAPAIWRSRTGRPLTKTILRQRIGAMPGRQAGEAPEPDALAFGLDLQGVVAKFTAQNLGQPRQRPLAIGRTGLMVETAQAFAAERKAHIRMGHGQPLDHIGHRLRLGARAFEEFEPRRRGGEQVADFDPASLRQRGRRRRRRPRRIRPAGRSPCGASAVRVAISSARPRRSRAAPRRESRAWRYW